MNFHMTDDMQVILPRVALSVIFDECDRYDHDETGGRVLGTYQQQGGTLTLRITGIIEPGPGARRSAVTFFQDGRHQEKIFRQIEEAHPETEHLGNWHTHHMNGLQHLSGGDIATYRRTVAHPKQHTPFFYALLVTTKTGSRDPLSRYLIRHYIFLRGDDRVFEIPASYVALVDEPLVWPHAQAPAPKPARHGLFSRPVPAKLQPPMSAAAPASARGHPERAHDHAVLSEFFPGMRPFQSTKLGIYWRGPIQLIDDRRVETVVIENQDGAPGCHSVLLRDVPPDLAEVADQLSKQSFCSARSALIATERACSRAIHAAHRHAKSRQ